MTSRSTEQLRVLLAHERFVRWQLRRYGASPSAIEDLVQEVWVIALARSEPLTGGQGLLAWLSSVCRKLAATERRTRSRVGELSETTPVDATPPVQVEALQHKDEHGLTLAALARLPARQLDVLMLYASGELSMREVAGVLGEKEPAVYARYRSAVEELRKVVQELRVSADDRPASSRAPAWLSLPEIREAAADLGDLTIYRADEDLAMGRIGNVLIVRWRKRAFEHSSKYVGVMLNALHARLQAPIALVNDVAPDFAVPNGSERRELFAVIEATRTITSIAVDIWNGNPARLAETVLDGILSLVQVHQTYAVAMVPDLQSAQPWLEPYARSLAGPLEWEPIREAIESVRAAGEGVKRTEPERGEILFG